MSYDTKELRRKQSKDFLKQTIERQTNEIEKQIQSEQQIKAENEKKPNRCY